MSKVTLSIVEYINPAIKAGDKVRIVDGSSLTPLNYVKKDFYIVNSYPNLTGTGLKLEEITGEVIFTGIKNSVCTSYDRAYLQDCVIQLGNGLFRTCSQFLKKVSL